jgi:integrase
MPRVFRKVYTRPIPLDAERVTQKGKPAVRFRDAGGKSVVAFLTKRGDRCRMASPTWYGTVDGEQVPLCTNKTAAELMLAELVKKAEMGRQGISDPYEDHRLKPLAEHLADYHLELEARGNSPRYVALVVSRLSDLLSGCGFRLIPDLSAGRVMEWLADLRRHGRPLPPLPPGQEWFAPREAARLLGVGGASIRAAVSRHRLAAEGQGPSRRYPRATVEALRERAVRGASAQTSNYYLSHLKSFCRWLVRERRMGQSPVAHLQPGNERTDRRHDRRELDADELRRLLTATQDSDDTIRGLSGRDRYHLYATACGTGFRASALASLTPESFDLSGELPAVTLAARHAKNRKTKVQPIPPELADLLRDYLSERPAGQPVWGGTWARDRKGAVLMRHDLATAGIPYVVDGPDGPLFADFHSLRHSYLTLGGRAGIDLRTLQELAGHSTPILTARYSHRRLYDLAGAVEKLPRLLPDDAPTVALLATGTEGPSPDSEDNSTPSHQRRLHGACTASDSVGVPLRVLETPSGGDEENTADRNPLSVQGVATDGDSGREAESRPSEEAFSDTCRIRKLEPALVPSKP